MVYRLEAPTTRASIAPSAVYSFVLTEGDEAPDLKVFVQPDASMLPRSPPPKFYSSAQVAEIKRGSKMRGRTSSRVFLAS